MREYQINTKHLYNLDATPAEGTSYRLAQLDRKISEIISQGKDVSTPIQHTFRLTLLTISLKH